MTYGRPFEGVGHLDANKLPMALADLSTAPSSLLLLLAIIDPARAHRVDGPAVTASCDRPSVTIEMDREGRLPPSAAA